MPSPRLAAIVAILCMAFPAFSGAQENDQKYYNVKLDPVYFKLSARTSMEYNDNVNLSSGVGTPIFSDFIISPSIGLTAFTDLEILPAKEVDRTRLSLTANIGYAEYLMHPNLSSNLSNVTIAPDSELAFVIHAGHFRIRVHDGFSMQSDPVSEGSLSNVAQFSRFVNTAAIDTHWAMNSKTTVDLNLSHGNLWALSLVTIGTSGARQSLSTNNLNSYTDRATLIGESQFLSILSAGATASAAYTTYPSDSAQDDTIYTAGPFTKIRLTQYTFLNASCGATETRNNSFFTGNGAAGFSGIIARDTTGASSHTTEYFDVTLANNLNIYYNHSLSVGRETAMGLLGSVNETDYARYTSTWKVNSKTTLASGLFLEQTNDLGIIGNASHYRRYGLTLTTGRQLSRKLTTMLSYRFTDKRSGDSVLDYKQNSIVWSFDYQF